MASVGTRISRLVLGAGTILGAWSYVGYPATIAFAAKLRRRRTAPRRPPLAESALPSMTVVVPAYNEAAVIEKKIADTRAQDYPAAKLDILVSDDGSDDGTAAIARNEGAHVISGESRRGKSMAINAALERAKSEIIVFSDANCALGPGALRAIAVHFRDPQVGLVAGAKTVLGDEIQGRGEGAYWRYESWIKGSESEFGVVQGATGELMAFRNTAIRPLPASTINDDFSLTLQVFDLGFLVHYEPEARTHEHASPTIAEEFERRTRISAGTWQATLRHIDMADPRRGWLSTAFISHRVLRNLVVPLLLVPMWVAAAALARSSRFARLMFGAQTVVYGAALLGYATGDPRLAPALVFTAGNIAEVRGGLRLLAGRQRVTWRKADRSRYG